MFELMSLQSIFFIEERRRGAAQGREESRFGQCALGGIDGQGKALAAQLTVGPAVELKEVVQVPVLQTFLRRALQMGGVGAELPRISREDDWRLSAPHFAAENALHVPRNKTAGDGDACEGSGFFRQGRTPRKEGFELPGTFFREDFLAVTQDAAFKNEIAADIGDTVAAGRMLAASSPSKWRPDVAIVTDEDGAWLRNIISHYFNADESCLMGGQTQTLAASGVPCEKWLMQDWLEDTSLAKRYKTVLFFGMYDIDDRRAALLDALRTEGRTLVFMAGTGAARGVERIGFSLGEKPFPAKHETAAEPAVKWNMGSLMHARKIGMIGVNTGWPWQFSSPSRLYLEPASGLKPMARFTEDGTIAVAERADAGAKLVYVAAYGGLTPDYFHHLAKESGAYVPTDGHGLEIDMNGDFISIHCLVPGHYDFTLPFKARVQNMKTGAAIGSLQTSIEMNLTAGESRWYRIKEEK